MAKETFIMVSLEEDKSKELAQVISNATSRKILDYLGGKDEISEADMSKELKMPMSTIHYNIQQLLKAGLVEKKKFMWSEKGKKIYLYSIAKKLIVIAPKGSESLKERLKGIIPIALISLLGSLGLYVYQKLGRMGEVTMQTASKAADTFSEASPAMMESAPEIARGGGPMLSHTPTELNYALWFLIGSMFVVVIYFMYTYWRYRK